MRFVRGITFIFACGLLGCASEGDDSAPTYTFSVSNFASADDAAIQWEQSLLSCSQRPSQVYVFGDSIAACYGVADGACGVGILQDSLEIPLTNAAVSGALTADVASQIAGVEVAPGPALVLIQIIGNDLVPFLGMSDEQVQQQAPLLMEQLRREWEDSIFVALQTQFPDGFLLIMNTQYKPFECSLGAVRQDMMLSMNQLLIDIAQAHADSTLIANSYPGFLGHANGFDDPSCPSFSADNVGWMNDPIHPNELGHDYLGQLWATAADHLIQACP